MDCIFSQGLIPDFTLGTKFYGVRNGQNLRIFNILTTTVEIYMPFTTSLTSIQDVGGNIQKLILVGAAGMIHILDISQGTILLFDMSTSIGPLSVACYDKVSNILGLGSTVTNFRLTIAYYNRGTCHPSCEYCTGEPVIGVDHKCSTCKSGLGGTLNAINGCDYSCVVGTYPN